jgi:hypothetical protein
MFSKEVMGGGTGTVFASDTIIFMGKQQEKEGKELLGWNFILNIEKSRFVQEKEKIGVLVTYKKGIYKYSGMFDLGVEFGLITSPSKGWYELNGEKVRRAAVEADEERMEALINDPEFKRMVAEKYKLSETEADKVEVAEEE